MIDGNGGSVMIWMCNFCLNLTIMKIILVTEVGGWSRWLSVAWDCGWNKKELVMVDEDVDRVIDDGRWRIYWVNATNLIHLNRQLILNLMGSHLDMDGHVTHPSRTQSEFRPIQVGDWENVI